nr:hypothetical protein [Mycoplasmopsis bovis]
MTNRKFFKGMLIGSAPVILLPTIALQHAKTLQLKVTKKTIKYMKTPNLILY